MIHSTLSPAKRHTRSLALAGIVAIASALGLAGCAKKQGPAAPSATPPPSYTGPAFLRGTVGSMSSLRQGSDRGLLVSGYGVVVFPPGLNNGSSEVPAFLRQRLINEMRKQGIGSAAARANAPDRLKPFLRLTPEQFLDLPTTAVVSVQGLIPPGATPGTRFDLLVTALDQTQTMSLAGGTLWTTQLGVQGINPQFEFVTPLAEGYGPMYLDPLDHQTPEDERHDFQRQAVVVGGGTTLEPRQLEVVLNQPSWQRSRLISDRINERLGRNSDRKPLAEPQTDLLIRLNVPPRWRQQPDVLLNLISHLYVQRGAEFESRKARQLAKVLESEPNLQETIYLTWRTLGRTAIPVLREYYESDLLHMRLTALEAGASLEDERASRYLNELADHEDAEVRSRVADALVHLPRSLQGARTLRRLLNDPESSVRIRAYESLAAINDRNILDRFGVSDGRKLKFIIDRVPAERPLVYVTQEDVPRLVVFGDVRFETPVIARLWDNHLMLRASGGDEPMTIFYQPPGEIEPITQQLYPHSVAALAYALGHSPHEDDLQDGFALSYSEVVDAIYQVCRQGHVKSPIELAMSPLAQRVSDLQDTPMQRPERDESLEGEQPPQPRPQGRPELSAGPPAETGTTTP